MSALSLPTTAADTAVVLAEFLATIYSDYLAPDEALTDDGAYALVPRLRDGGAGKGPMPVEVWTFHAEKAMDSGPEVGEGTAVAISVMGTREKLKLLAAVIADYSKYQIEADLRAGLVRHIVAEHGQDLIAGLLEDGGGHAS